MAVLACMLSSLPPVGECCQGGWIRQRGFFVQKPSDHGLSEY